MIQIVSFVATVRVISATVMHPTIFSVWFTGEARYLHQECYTSQRMRSEMGSNLTYIMRADHEFYCSSTAPINHKVTAGTESQVTESRL